MNREGAKNGATESLGPLLGAAQRSKAAWALATLLGAGWLPLGPGTWASAITAAVWLALAGRAAVAATGLWTLAAALLVTLIGVPAAGTVARESGSSDPRCVVIDEVAGQLLALVALPGRWQYALASFILFRGFDIFKPPPLRRLEKLAGGWGIMLDDVGAGLYALALAQLWIWAAR